MIKKVKILKNIYSNIQKKSNEEIKLNILY